jgi:hypothetical protein
MVSQCSTLMELFGLGLLPSGTGWLKLDGSGSLSGFYQIYEEVKLQVCLQVAVDGKVTAHCQGEDATMLVTTGP